MQTGTTQNSGARRTQDIFPGVSQQFFAAAVPEADSSPFVNTEYGIRALFKYLVHATRHVAVPRSQYSDSITVALYPTF